MLYCEDCGQCVHINDDYFKEHRRTWGWEMITIEPVEGDYCETLDVESTDSEHESYECPHCLGANVTYRENVDHDIALIQRERYRIDQEGRKKAQKEKQLAAELEQKASDPNREWGVMENV